MRIICCGTPFRADDAAGFLVAERLQQLGIEARMCVGDGTDLLQAREGAEEVLLVNAVLSGARAGTIYEWHNCAQFQLNCASSHALGVAEGIALARALGRLPERLHIYSIEAKTFEIRDETSVEIMRAADELARRIADFFRAVPGNSNHGVPPR